MADVSKQIDVENILSYCDDLVEVLRAKRDVNNLTRCVDHSSSIQSSFAVDFEEVLSSIQDCEKKIADCGQKTDEARSSVVADEEIDSLQKGLDEEICREELLQGELRYVFACATLEEQIDDLDQQRLSIEERRLILKKLELDGAKARSKLSFYASVTNIIPNLESDHKISGQIVKKDEDVVDMFEFDLKNADSFDLCNSIWEMMD